MLQKYFVFEIPDVADFKAAVFLCFRHEALESGRIVQTLQRILLPPNRPCCLIHQRGNRVSWNAGTLLSDYTM